MSTGKHWRESTILSILSNEKYKGDALLQKTFTADFLTKRHKRNEGEVQQYYVTGNHEPIIAPQEFDEVQAELARRKQVGRSFSGTNPFSSRIVCGDCGGFYGQKVWHSNDPYRKVIWRCNRKYGGTRENGEPGNGEQCEQEERVKGEHGNGEQCECGNGECSKHQKDNRGKAARCSTPTLSEDDIKALFVKAYNLLLGDMDAVIEDCEMLVAILEDNLSLDEKIAEAQAEIDAVSERNKALIREHATTGMEQGEFDRKAWELNDRFQKAVLRLNKLKEEKQDRLRRACSVRRFVEDLLEVRRQEDLREQVQRGLSELEQAERSQGEGSQGERNQAERSQAEHTPAEYSQAGTIDVWSEQAWRMLVTQVTVYADGSAEFLFKGENKITVKIE